MRQQVTLLASAAFLVFGLTAFQVLRDLGLGVCGNLITEFLKYLWRAHCFGRRGSFSVAARRTKALRRGERIFDSLKLFLPTRLWKEDLGDALESLRRLNAAGATPGSLYLKIGTTVLWALVNAVREDAAAPGDGRRTRVARTNSKGERI